MSGEFRAVGISVIVLVLGLAVIAATKVGLNVEGDAVFISLLLLPAVTYMVVSGRIKELKGPGGLEASFYEVATSTVNPTIEPVATDPSDLQLIPKGPIDALQTIKQNIDESKPGVMVLELGDGSHHSSYDLGALRAYFEALSSYRNFKFVVFTGLDHKVIAYMPAWTVNNLISTDALGEEFITVINRGDSRKLLMYPGIIDHIIDTGKTNADALREMMDQNLEALVVVDGQRRLQGIVEREQVLSRMLLALTK
jgi:hypothetical protein